MTYAPGALAIGSCAALPSAVGAGRFSPERAASQATWSTHQLPGCVTAPASQSAADSGRLSLTRKLDLTLVGGLTSAAMWPAVESTKRVSPPSSWALR